MLRKELFKEKEVDKKVINIKEYLPKELPSLRKYEISDVRTAISMVKYICREFDEIKTGSFTSFDQETLMLIVRAADIFESRCGDEGKEIDEHLFETFNVLVNIVQTGFVTKQELKYISKEYINPLKKLCVDFDSSKIITNISE